METLINIAFLGGTIFGFILGKFWERIAWNRLIEKGILPKPKKKKS